jgi:CheY-like chemotaxis protein
MRQTKQGLRILVVDDEEDMCWALQRILEAEGHAGTIANSAGEALRLVRQEAFHLAFVDVKLPDMDGFDLVARLRTVCPTMPCILLSGYLYDDDVSVQAGLSEGLIRDFIGKPFLLSEIRDTIRLAIDSD